jgi:hypothetical protein
MSVVSVVCCAGRGLCDELITRPEESYRLWCVVVRDLENLMNEETMANVGPLRHKEKKIVYVIPYFSIDNARFIYTKRYKFVKNEHARYTLEIWNLKNLERLITATSQARF